MCDFETRVAVAEVKGLLRELRNICGHVEYNLAWDNLTETSKELMEVKSLIETIDNKIKTLETQNKVDEEELY